MKLRIKLAGHTPPKISIQVNSSESDIQVEVDNQPSKPLTQPDSTKMLELEVLMRPAQTAATITGRQVLSAVETRLIMPHLGLSIQ